MPCRSCAPRLDSFWSSSPVAQDQTSTSRSCSTNRRSSSSSTAKRTIQRYVVLMAIRFLKVGMSFRPEMSTV